MQGTGAGAYQNHLDVAARQILKELSERPVKVCADIGDAQMTNPYISRILEGGGTMEDCVVALTNNCAELLRKVIELECIAPKRYRINDKVYVWRCPDCLIPIKENKS